MLDRIFSLPFIVILMGIGAISMFIPAIHAAASADFVSMRAFFYSATIFLLLTTLIGIATQGHKPKSTSRSHLLALLATYTVLPLMLAVPLNEAVPDTRFINAYVEMISSLTTTGATMFDDPARLTGSVHLWRALVGWMGGFFVLVTAIAILAPMNLGGFEVLAPHDAGRSSEHTKHQSDVSASTRLVRYSGRLFPVYAGLTLLLWMGLYINGDSALVSLCHAMSTLATSGISPIGGVDNNTTGLMGEGIMLLFFLFALSRRTFSSDRPGEGYRALKRDPEFRIGILVAVVVPTFLVLRHWLGAYEVDGSNDIRAALGALWGSAFTVLSFLTTTGFVSSEWANAHAWSGLTTPGLILLGLCLVGGGVATTAGGVKLLRVYALYTHGIREMEKLVHPNSIGGSGSVARQLRKQGAYVAWLFFMLFALSVALVMGALALDGLDFETATVLTVASLATTGPLSEVAAEAPISYALLSDTAKMIVSAAMVLGRLETLAIIALLNPEFWRQ